MRKHTLTYTQAEGQRSSSSSCAHLRQLARLQLAARLGTTMRNVAMSPSQGPTLETRDWRPAKGAICLLHSPASQKRKLGSWHPALHSLTPVTVLSPPPPPPSKRPQKQPKVPPKGANTIDLSQPQAVAPELGEDVAPPARTSALLPFNNQSSIFISQPDLLARASKFAPASLGLEGGPLGGRARRRRPNALANLRPTCGQKWAPIIE